MLTTISLYTCSAALQMLTFSKHFWKRTVIHWRVPNKGTRSNVLQHSIESEWMLWNLAGYCIFLSGFCTSYCSLSWTQSRLSGKKTYWLRQWERLSLRDGSIQSTSTIRLHVSALLLRVNSLQLQDQVQRSYTTCCTYPGICSLPLAQTGSCVHLCTNHGMKAKALTGSCGSHRLWSWDQHGRSIQLDVLRVGKNNFPKQNENAVTKKREWICYAL